MPRSVQHWRGEIPTSIQPHPEADLSLDQIKEEVKGWLLFVQVCVYSILSTIFFFKQPRLRR